jgi:lysophospholipase L1-like esterase
MPRTLQLDPNKFPKRTITFSGDSQTHNYVLGVAPTVQWPQLVADSLNADGAHVKSRNLGINGTTTTQMLSRVDGMYHYEIPEIAVLAGGVNDPGGGISTATTQSNVEAWIAAVVAAGVTRVLICNIPYRNFSSSYTSTRDTLSTPYAQNETLRTALSDDAYTYMRNLIVAGTVADGVAPGITDFHIIDGNQHLSLTGHAYYADAVVECIQAQTGWVTAIT